MSEMMIVFYDHNYLYYRVYKLLRVKCTSTLKPQSCLFIVYSSCCHVFVWTERNKFICNLKKKKKKIVLKLLKRFHNVELNN